jgi:2-oxoglutarate ferredoxin oxidoreductase subunit beta
MEIAEPFSIKRYLRPDLTLPFCAGCGCVNTMSSFLRAAQELGHKDLSKFVFCSGIGCSAWIPSPYLMADSLHVLHGRSIPAALGVKIMRPDLNVVVFGGDGDIAGIGLSHMVHAARRNLDIMVVMVNNMIYGMTGGQLAPTTPYGMKTTTTPYGSFEYSLDVTRLAVTAGASYVARYTTAHGEELTKAMKKAITTKGFSFIEAVSPCPTAFGRRVGFKDVAEILRWLKNNSVPLEQASGMSDQELKGKIVTGEYVHREKPTLTDNIYSVVKEAQKLAPT